MLAERLRRAIADARIDCPTGGVIALTATIGVAGWQGVAIIWTAC